ncbi:NUMA1 [Mytilus edulis]|uniref:NUMA1 n=1 Tax=Mytilus edulis TaxID=6550 RepID=A0A8S3S2E9_MYTED|nr:NUMA1 [Mytilus edulis]
MSCDYSFIADVQELLENAIHQRSQRIRGSGVHPATIATDDGSLFEKLSGMIPTLRDFRVFILQWQVEMQQKNIDQESDISNLNLNQENFRMALDHAVHVSTEQQNQLQNLITDRVNLQRRFEQAIDTAEQLNTINVQHVSNNGLLQNECARLIGANTQVTSRCDRLHQDNRRKDMQIVGLDKENVQLSVEVAEKDTTIKQKDITIKQKDTTINQLSEEVSEKDTTIKQKDSTINQLSEEVSEKRHFHKTERFYHKSVE